LGINLSFEFVFAVRDADGEVIVIRVEYIQASSGVRRAFFWFVMVGGCPSHTVTPLGRAADVSQGIKA